MIVLIVVVISEWLFSNFVLFSFTSQYVIVIQYMSRLAHHTKLFPFFSPFHKQPLTSVPPALLFLCILLHVIFNLVYSTYGFNAQMSLIFIHCCCSCK